MDFCSLQLHAKKGAIGGTRGRLDKIPLVTNNLAAAVEGRPKLTRSIVRHMRVAQLREELRLRKMDSSGLRPALIDRLLSVVA